MFGSFICNLFAGLVLFLSTLTIIVLLLIWCTNISRGFHYHFCLVEKCADMQIFFIMALFSGMYCSVSCNHIFYLYFSALYAIDIDS